MDILIAGRLAALSAPFCDTMAARHKVVLSSEEVQTAQIGKKATPFKSAPHDTGFEKLFHSYSFGAVLFFSQRPETQQEYFDELQDLERTLRLCADHDVEKIVYIASTSVFAGLDQFDEKTAPVPINGTGVVLDACERLCRFYRSHKSLQVLTLHTPCIFGYGETGSMIGRLAGQAVSKASIRFPGPQDQLCELLSEADLAELLVRLLDDWKDDLFAMHLPGSTQATFGEMAKVFQQQLSTVRVSFSERLAPLAVPVTSRIARQEYDWVPVRAFDSELPQMLLAFQGEVGGEEKSRWQKVKDFFAKHRFIVRMVEVLLGFVIVELLNYFTRTTIQFQYIDFRLLYVVLLASLHGMKTGLAAALLACISCINGYMTTGIDWRVLVYNVDNWLPFACYISIGAIAGYTKDKQVSSLAFMTKEKELLEERYIFLNELYASALNNKEQFKNQIMSYRDSFGRIFEVTKKLNNILPDAIFKEALSALEDILDNQSICIYSVDEYCRFGRLMVCSKKISDTTTKTVQLSNYNMMTRDFHDGEVWSNTDRLLGYPEYAAPIFHDQQVVALITVQKVRYEQMAIYYVNLIKVLCGLIQVSLLRALEYEKYLENEIYLPGTRIMEKEHFKQLLRVKEKMEEDAISEYTILHISAPAEEMGEMSEIITSKLRTTDVLGQGEDGELYLILSQTNQENLGFVLNRLREAGIVFQSLGPESEG